jgi:3-oxoadipyl-CoA thiolase
MLADIRTDDLAALPLQALVRTLPSVDWAQLDEVILGCINQAGEDNRNVARMAALLAGLPVSVAGITLNRLCASGLEAIIAGARAIALGDAHLVIAGGVEGSSRGPYVLSKSSAPYGRDVSLYDSTFGWRFINRRLEAEYGVDTMPQTAENVAEQFQVSRDDQDEYAFRSQARTQAAKMRGYYTDEITPVVLPDGTSMLVDENPRPETTREKLKSLRPYVRADGSVTVGNSSSLNDGAAAVLLASERAVELYGLDPLVRIEAATAVGVEPRIMGIGPVPAVQRLCERRKLVIADLDAIELNEAFASQVLACTRQLGLGDDAEHVNSNGGAIALGHPLGMSGTRIALTAARSLRLNGGKRGVATMCVGVGQGVALSMVRV